MAFAESSSNIELRGAVLHADCLDQYGRVWHSTLNLDSFIGNDNGHFSLGWSNFSRSACDIELTGTFLEAKLLDGNGVYHDAAINLNKCIYNNNGRLCH